MKQFVILLFTCIILLSGGVFAGAQEAVYHKISVADARKMMSELIDFVFIDVRPESAYNKAHITGAISIPSSRAEERIQAEFPDRKKVMFLYCETGGRAMAVAKKLVRLGYVNVYNTGSFSKWSKAMKAGAN